jgi:hypothetical protein
MPAFVLDHGSPEGARGFAKLDAFTQGYVEAMFFTDASCADDGELEDATFDDLAPEALARIQRDCEAFQTAHAALLEEAYTRDDYSEEQAGRDYWFTRNGHGVGYWDREQLNDGGLGDKLSAAARYSTVDLYRGDDGLVYLA